MTFRFLIWCGLLLSVLDIPSFAQKITYSDEIELSKNAYFNAFSGDEFHYLFTQNNKESVIKIYNQNLKFKNEVVLDFLEGQVLSQYLFFKQHKIFSFWIRMDQRQLFMDVAILNDQGILETHQTYPIDEMTAQDWKNGSFHWKENTLKDYLGFSFSNRRKGQLYLIKYDVNQGSLALAQQELPRLKSSRVLVEEQLLWTKNALLWIQKNNSTINSDLAEPIYIYEMGRVDHQINAYSLPHENLNLGDQQIFYDEYNDRLYLISLYSDKKNKLPSALKVQEIQDQGVKDIQEMTIEDYILKSLNNHLKKLELNDFKIQDMAFRKDGGFFIGLQVQYLMLKNYAFQNMMSFSMSTISTKRVREYYFGEYIGIQYHVEKDKNWQNILRKTQHTQEDYGYFSSISTLNTGQQLVIFYNDLNHRRNQIQIGVLQSTGEVIYGQIPRTKLRPSYKAIPRLAYSLSPIKIMMPIYYDTGTIGLMKVDFTDSRTTHNKVY